MSADGARPDVALEGERDPQPALIHGEPRPEVLRPVLAWAALNTQALVDYRDGRPDTVELGARLRRHSG